MLRYASILLLSLSLSVGCDLGMRPTKVGNGQLYASGDGRFDPYFQTVHQEQLGAASWPDESKAARKPIVTALDLRPGSSNSLVLSAAKNHEKKGDAAITHAVDETTAAERELERKLNAAADRLEDLQKRGEDLRKQAIEERRNLAADKADDTKVAKKEEVKREISAAVEVVEGLVDSARKGAREAHELSRKLKSAWTGKDEPDEDDKKDEKKEEKKDDKKKDDKKPEPSSKKPAPAAPAKKPAEKPAEKAPAEKPEKPAEKPAEAAKPPPAQKPPEVFNP